MSKTLFTACLGTETNSFSPIPTGMDLFRRTLLVRDGAHPASPHFFALPLIVWRQRAQALGWRVVEGLAAFATPAGNTTRATFEQLCDEIVSKLHAAMPVDAVLLNLHGAMIADGYPDAEGELIRRVRVEVGPTVPIGVELDLHCHLTEQKQAHATAIVIYKEYPHVDVTERAEELFTLIEATLSGRLRPVMAVHDCRMLGIFPTTREPMRGFVDRMSALEGRDGIVSVSLAHGFPWGDTPEVGARVLVVADGDRGQAQSLAARLAEAFWSLRREVSPPFVSVDAAVARIAGHPGGKPLVLADTADNPGIGAAGDSTFLLAALLARQIGGVAIAPFWDPVATSLAFEAGLGACLDLRLGGKLGPASGVPVDVRVHVRGLVHDAQQPFGPAMAGMGNMAWLRIGLGRECSDCSDRNRSGDHSDFIDVVVNDFRTQGFAPACFTAAGLELARYRGLVVKSTQHFHAGFLPVAAEILYVSAPGTGAMDMRALPFRHVTRALWPRVDDPGSAG